MCPIQIAIWNIFIVPHVIPKSPKMSDTWQPLVLQRHHADIIMTCVTLCTCHVICTNDEVIRIDADMSSMDAYSSLLTRLG
jgi:hypothetical protein